MLKILKFRQKSPDEVESCADGDLLLLEETMHGECSITGGDKRRMKGEHEHGEQLQTFAWLKEGGCGHRSLATHVGHRWPTLATKPHSHFSVCRCHTKRADSEAARTQESSNSRRPSRPRSSRWSVADS